MEKILNKESRKNVFVIFIIAIAILIANMSYLTLHTFNNVDEFSALAVPATLAGYDWSDAVSISGWHGWGMTILLTPLFAIFDDAVIVYRLSLLLCLFFLVIVTMLVYKILTKHLGLNWILSLLISISYIIGTLTMDNVDGLSLLSEIPLGGLVMLSIYLLYELFEATKKKRIILSGLLGIVLAYCYLLHSRCIVIYFSFLLTFVLYKFIFGKNIVHLVLFPVCFVGALLLLYFINGRITEHIYMAQSVQTLPNESTKIISDLDYLLLPLLDINMIKLIIFQMLCQLGTLTLLSGGFVWVLIIGTVIQVKKSFENRKIHNNRDQKLFIMATFGILSIIFTMLSVALVALGPVIEGDLRWLTYIRYLKPFLGAIYLTGSYSVCMLMKNKGYLYGIGCGAAASVLFINVWMLDALRVRQGLSYSILNNLIFENDILLYFTFYSKLVLICAFLYIIVIKKRKVILSFSIFLVLSIIFNMQITDNIVTRNDVLVENVSESMLIVEEFFHDDRVKIYCDGNSNAYCFYMQFFAYDIPLSLLSEYDNVVWEETLLLSDINRDQEINALYKLQLAEKQFAYTSNQDIYNQLTMNN